MELSERLIQTLESEGFASVYEWQDKPNATYEKQRNEVDVAYLVTDGGMLFDFSGETKELHIRERLDIKSGIEYSIEVGSEGAIYIKGEK